MPETRQQKPPLACVARAVLGPTAWILAIVLLAHFLGLRPASAAGEVDRAEQWFNSLSTMEARFTQIASDGSYSEGTLYLKRPFRSRFEYDDPTPLVLITTKTWLHVDEKDQREVTSYPISETPLATLLGDPVRLTSPDFTTSADTADGLVRVTLDQTSGEAAGRLVLEFTQDPFELRRWLITDSNGITTTVHISNIVKGGDLPNSLFVHTDYPDSN